MADLSHLDLSYMLIARDSNQLGQPGYKQLQLDHCNLKGTTILNLIVANADTTASDVHGADFTTSSLEIWMDDDVAKSIGFGNNNTHLSTTNVLRKEMSCYRIQRMWPKAVSVFLLSAEKCDSPKKKIELLEHALKNYTFLKDVEADLYPDCFLMDKYLNIRLGACYAEIGDLPNAYRCLSAFLTINKVRQTLAEMIIRSPRLKFKDTNDQYTLALLLLTQVPQRIEDQLISHETDSMITISDYDMRRLTLQSCASLLNRKTTLSAEKTLEAMLGLQRVEHHHVVKKALEEAIVRAKSRLQFHSFSIQAKEITYSENEISEFIDFLTECTLLTNPFKLLAKNTKALDFISNEIHMREEFFSGDLTTYTTMEDIILNSKCYASKDATIPPSKIQEYEELEKRIFAELSELLPTLDSNNLLPPLNAEAQDESAGIQVTEPESHSVSFFGKGF